ncbi:MAG: hypothetical protein PHP50_12285 [Lachnospiraceae bacterium]|nr:hypothetical protein [Lachnospiraceae bacterium]
MLKIRFQGTKSDIQWLVNILEQEEEICILQVSDAFVNKGTSRYVRVYAEVEKI